MLTYTSEYKNEIGKMTERLHFTKRKTEGIYKNRGLHKTIWCKIYHPYPSISFSSDSKMLLPICDQPNPTFGNFYNCWTFLILNMHEILATGHQLKITTHLKNNQVVPTSQSYDTMVGIVNLRLHIH